MGQASRTTKLFLDLGKRDQGGTNREKCAALSQTVKILDAARAFYVAFFLTHAEKVTERGPYFSEQHQEMRERLLSTDKLLTWAEFQTVETAEHPHPLPTWNFSRAFPDFPFIFRRSVVKDAIGKKQGKPGLPGAANYNASVNLHHSFYGEFCWQRKRKSPKQGSGHTRLRGYRSLGSSIQEGNPVDRMPGPHASEHARSKVVGLALAQRGNVPIHISSRASPDLITFCNVAGTVESWTEAGRRKRQLSKIVKQFGNC